MRRLRCNAAVLKSSLCASEFAVMGSISFIKKVPEPPGLYEAPNLIKSCDRKVTDPKHDDARQRLQRGGHRCRWPDGECRQAWQGPLETQFLHGLVDHFLRQRDVAILTTTSWPCLDITSLMNSASSGLSGLFGALFT